MTEQNPNQENLLDGNRGKNIQPRSIENEMQESYIEYAMSVIVSRALPDVRDGFKPVLRRILFAMNQIKLFHNAKYRKSMNVVGEVLGKYHPHGDSSVYEAMVRMAQDWSLRYPLVDGQGNFGSIDGDGAAAARYTEVRMTKIAEEMMSDIEKDTVLRAPNYDNRLEEPVMLPTKFPNHLCNGTMGIAVGMATNMPPHNLTEVLDACLLAIDNPEATVDDLMEIIKGPDLPTGGYIFDPEQIKEVYRKGKGPIVMRGKTHIEDNGKEKIIVISEVPYQVNKSRLVEKMAELVIEKKIEGITDIRDESSKDEMRIAVYMKPTANDRRILLQLYKSTELQSNFSVNNITLVENGRQPQLLNIKDLIFQYVDFRREVVFKRTTFELNKAKDRLHILEGLKKAIDIIDEVIETIKKSSTKQDAKENLMKKFDFSEIQSEYILLMRLQSLVGLEIDKISEEIEEKLKLIEYLEGIINDPKKLDGVLKEEMTYMKDKYGDERKTQVIDDKNVYNLKKLLKGLDGEADVIPEDCIVWISDDYKFRSLYQTRTSYIPDETHDIIYTQNQDKLVIVTDRGELVVQRIKDFGSFTTKSTPLDLAKHFGLKGKILFAKTLHFHYDTLVFLTNRNNIKKIDKNVVLSFKKFPTTIMKLTETGEKLVGVKPVVEGDHIGIFTEKGKMLLFPEANVRPMGKSAGGVRAIELDEGDKTSAMMIYKDEPFIMVYSDKQGKILNFEDLRVRKRAKRGQVIAELKKGEKISGAISIQEGAVRIRNQKDEYITLHSNDILLDEPEGAMEPLIKTGTIMNVFRPWEEKSENMSYKEEKKAKAKAEREQAKQEGLFAEDAPAEEAKSEKKDEKPENNEAETPVEE